MNDPQEVFRKREFCARNKISLSKFRQLDSEGRGPARMLDSPVRITREAELEWRAARAAEAANKDRQLELARRRAHMGELGRKSAASPNHVSKQGPRKPRRRAVWR
jgi:hypothetical protein